MERTILKKGDEIRVIAPSSSAKKLGDSMDLAKLKLESLGYKVTYGKNIFEMNEFMSSSITSRVEDLHDAFLDKDVKLIMSAVGGFRANQLLPYIDYELIKNNPKLFCGYSDITVLHNAIYTQTGLITYLGPHFSSFAMKKGFDYTQKYFDLIFLQNQSFEIESSSHWSDEAWFMDQENRTFYETDGYQILNEGEAEGVAIGGNLNTFNLLQGTKCMPSLKDKILVIEDTGELYQDCSIYEFDRNLESLTQCEDFKYVKGIVFGRHQICSNIGDDMFVRMLKDKAALKNIPIIYNANIGHTTPLATIPIGGCIQLNAKRNKSSIYVKTF